MVHVDLVELADLARPEQLVAELLRQNPQLPTPIPVEEIAHAVGIEEITAVPGDKFEGSLICDPAKSRGVILYNSNRRKTRQRFTIAHELGHFLLPWQRQTNFQCSAADLTPGENRSDWEVQANEFAAQLLLPDSLFKAQLRKLGAPELKHVSDLGETFETSIEFTARRYVELSEYPCAVVFSKDNVVRYSVASPYFEHRLCVRKGSALPTKSTSRVASGDSDEWVDIDAYWWLEESRSTRQPDEVYEQTLWQESGFKVTLLTL